MKTLFHQYRAVQIELSILYSIDYSIDIGNTVKT